MSFSLLAELVAFHISLDMVLPTICSPADIMKGRTKGRTPINVSGTIRVVG